MKNEVLKIIGMSCQHCVRSVRLELEKIPGITVNSVDIGTARIAYDETIVSPDVIAGAITRAGYELAATRPA